MYTEWLILTILFFAIALVYSSVGFGGGSSYLALLAVMAVDYTLIRPTALMCNIVVVTGGTFIFYKQEQLNLKKCLPFIIASIPMSYMGGYYPIKEKSFFITLGIALIIASLLLWFHDKLKKNKEENHSGADNILVNVGLGGGIGFLSGLVSIGGGIFLAPLLHLIKWDHARKISALASLFILVNSISGLAGQFTRSFHFDWKFAIPLIIAVLAGGQIGSRLGAKRFNHVLIKRITAMVILLAAINILSKHL